MATSVDPLKGYGFVFIQEVIINDPPVSMVVADIEPWYAFSDDSKAPVLANTQLVKLPPRIKFVHYFHSYDGTHVYRFHFSLPYSFNEANSEFLVVETAEHNVYHPYSKTEFAASIINRAVRQFVVSLYETYGPKHMDTITKALTNHLSYKLNHVNMERTEPVKTGGYSIGYSVPDTGPSVADMSLELPGVSAQVTPGCGCYAPNIKKALWYHIQHLNDTHEDWSRERIADWLDDLHDKGLVNIEFPAEKPEK